MHVVFGAGQVGGQLAARLTAAGHAVRVVKRPGGGVPEGAEMVLGDAADPSFCARAAAGAYTVYHCMNPAYSAALWEKRVPLYINNLIAARASDFYGPVGGARTSRIGCGNQRSPARRRSWS